MVVRVTGDVDTLTASLLAAALDDRLVRDSPHRVVDLSGVGFLSAAGITVLVRANERPGLCLVLGHGAAIKPLRVTNALAAFSRYGTVEEALRSLRPS